MRRTTGTRDVLAAQTTSTRNVCRHLEMCIYECTRMPGCAIGCASVFCHRDYQRCACIAHSFAAAWLPMPGGTDSLKHDYACMRARMFHFVTKRTRNMLASQTVSPRHNRRFLQMLLFVTWSLCARRETTFWNRSIPSPCKTLHVHTTRLLVNKIVKNHLRIAPCTHFCSLSFCTSDGIVIRASPDFAVSTRHTE